MRIRNTTWVLLALLVGCGGGDRGGEDDAGPAMDSGPGIRLMDGGGWTDAGTPPPSGDADTEPPGDDAGPGAGNDAGTGEPPPDEAECSNAIEQEQLRLTNEARLDAGLDPLVCDEALTRAARKHSQDMCDNDYFSHTSQDGRSFTDRIEEEGVRYGWAGENIAWGQPTAAAVHDTWMRSPGHRENILAPEFNRIGIGYVPCGGSPYWTQDFTD